jgi:hypothetical protein
MEKEIMPPKSFYETSVTLIPKLNMDTTERELQINLFDEHKCENSQ